MNKSPIIVTGLNGLIGSRFKLDYQNSYEITSFDISDPQNPVDITKKEQVLKACEASPASHVVHFAAYTDVTGAWKQRDDKSGLAYQVNVVGTQNIVEACNKTNKHLIHISTAYVFDGKNESLYTENDSINPIEWYGYTKAEAEQVVQTSSTNWTILRIDQPFRSDIVERPDIVRRIVTGIKENRLPPQFTNHTFGPTYINDFCKVIEWVIRTNATGLFHASSGEKWTDFDFASEVVKALSLPTTIQKGDLMDYLKTLERPYQHNTAMSSEKLQKVIDFTLTPIRKALTEIEQ